MLPSKETLMNISGKITGDIPDELPEAGIRLFASGLVKVAEMPVLKAISNDNNAAYDFLNKHEHIREAIIGFIVAAILEITPFPELGDFGKRLAYNIRIRSYEEIGTGVFFRLMPVIQDVQAEVARYMATNQALVMKNLQPKPDEGKPEQTAESDGAKVKAE